MPSKCQHHRRDVIAGSSANYEVSGPEEWWQDQYQPAKELATGMFSAVCLGFHSYIPIVIGNYFCPCFSAAPAPRASEDEVREPFDTTCAWGAAGRWRSPHRPRSSAGRNAGAVDDGLRIEPISAVCRKPAPNLGLDGWRRRRRQQPNPNDERAGSPEARKPSSRRCAVPEAPGATARRGRLHQRTSVHMA
jgi:hypothetical protein